MIYYSPTQTMGGGMSRGRNHKSPPFAPLLEQLDLTRGRRNWGYAFLFGLVEICAADYALIRSRMSAG